MDYLNEFNMDSPEWIPQLVNNQKSKPVSINGISYRSERYASQQTGINRKKLRKLLQSDEDNNNYYL